MLCEGWESCLLIPGREEGFDDGQLESCPKLFSAARAEERGVDEEHAKFVYQVHETVVGSIC